MEPGSWTGVSGVWWCMMFVSFTILDFTPAPKHLPGHMLIDRTHIPYTCMNKHNMHAWPYFFTPSSPGLQHPTVLTRSRVSIPRHQRCNSKTKLQGVSTRFSKLFWSWPFLAINIRGIETYNTQLKLSHAHFSCQETIWIFPVFLQTVFVTRCRDVLPVEAGWNEHMVKTKIRSSTMKY